MSDNSDNVDSSKESTPTYNQNDVDDDSITGIDNANEFSPENDNDLVSDAKSIASLKDDGLLDVSSDLDEINSSNNELDDDCKVGKRDEGIDIRDERIDIRDELDFEEQKESGEESDDEETSATKAAEDIQEEINREEGELSDDEEDESLLRQEPKTVCRFFNKGQCTWGTNCRFLHPGVSDKGNYNMFAPPKPQSQTEEVESTPEKEKPNEVRRYVPEVTGFETAWERGLRHAKEMKKRAYKRKETDADFEEKRFNLSLGQAELDRENDYYTRPASPVYKPSDDVVEYLDPYEKQAIRHFRGGHFENLEVHYNVDPASYPNNRNPEHTRSRRDKFDRQVSDRITGRRMRVPDQSPPADMPKVVKEKRYPKQPRVFKEEKGEAEVWADPWARRKNPLNRMRKKSTRSYSSGSSSRSSRSSRSRSSSYSSYSSRSSSESRSSSRSRSITPPVHPRQRAMNRGGGRQGIGIQQRVRLNPNQAAPNTQIRQAPNSQFRQAPNSQPRQGLNQQQRHAPNHPFAPNQRSAKDGRGTVPVQPKQEPNKKYPQEERVDMFGRTIRKELPPPSPKKKSVSRSPIRPAKGRRKYSLGSKSGSSTRSSKSRSLSRSRSSSSGSSIVSALSPAPVPKKKASAVGDSLKKKTAADRSRRLQQQGGAVSFGDSVKSKTVDVVKISAPKQIKMTLKKQLRPSDKTVLDNDDDSGESDTEARIPKKRKLEAPLVNLPAAKVMKVPAAIKEKKPSAARREELLKQLRAVEDAIARKRTKVVD